MYNITMTDIRIREEGPTGRRIDLTAVRSRIEKDIRSCADDIRSFLILPHMTYRYEGNVHTVTIKDLTIEKGKVINPQTQAIVCDVRRFHELVRGIVQDELLRKPR